MFSLLLVNINKMIKSLKIVFGISIIFLFLISSLLAEASASAGTAPAQTSTQATQLQNSYYNTLVKGGTISSSSLSDEDLSTLVSSKTGDDNYGSFIENMPAEDFQRAFRTKDALEQVSPGNDAVWARLETEMANGGNWMNEEENRPLLNKFLTESGVDLPEDFDSGTTAANGFNSRVDLLSYNKETGVAELRYSNSIFGGPTTTINLQEAANFGGVSLNSDGTISQSGANLGYGNFNFDQTSNRITITQSRAGDINIADYTGQASIHLNNAQGEGGVILNDGVRVSDTSYSLFRNTAGLISTRAEASPVSLFNSEGRKIAGITRGTATYNPAGTFDFSNVNNELGGVAIYDFDTGGLLSNSDAYGTVRYNGDWSLATRMGMDGYSSSGITNPLVTMSSRDTGLLDIGADSGRTLNIYNPTQETFTMTGVARDSNINAIRNGMTTSGDVLLTTQDGVNINLYRDGSATIPASQANIAGSFRGYVTSQSPTGEIGAIRFQDRLINVPFLADDTVEMGIVSGGEFRSNGIIAEAMSIPLGETVVGTQFEGTQGIDYTIQNPGPTVVRRTRAIENSATTYAREIDNRIKTAQRSSSQGNSGNLLSAAGELNNLANAFGSFGLTQARSRCYQLTTEESCNAASNVCELSDEGICRPKTAN